MRLLMTTDTVGGVWTFTRELTEGLLSQECCVTLVSFGRDPSEDQSAWANRIARDWPEQFRFLPTDFPLEWMQDNAGFYGESAALLERTATDVRADIVHTNQLCYGSLARQLPTLVTVHSDVRSWFSACRGHQPEPSPWIERYDHLVERGLRAANAVVAPTEWMLAQAQDHYGPLHNALTIPNGRNVSASPAPPARQKQAVTVGRLWDEGKDLALLDDVTSPMPLVVAGEHTGPDAAHNLGTPRVQWREHLTETDVLDLFRRSSIYVVTSRYEPFGLAPLEAALCGCALVARDIASLREVWGNAAIYFRDAAELSAVLQTLDRDEQLVSTMAQRATQRARRFGRQPMTERYLDLYRATVAARTGTLVERHVA